MLYLSLLLYLFLPIHTYTHSPSSTIQLSTDDTGILTSPSNPIIKLNTHELSSLFTQLDSQSDHSLDNQLSVLIIWTSDTCITCDAHVSHIQTLISQQTYENLSIVITEINESDSDTDIITERFNIQSYPSFTIWRGQTGHVITTPHLDEAVSALYSNSIELREENIVHDLGSVKSLTMDNSRDQLLSRSVSIVIVSSLEKGTTGILEAAMDASEALQSDDDLQHLTQILHLDSRSPNCSIMVGGWRVQGSEIPVCSRENAWVFHWRDNTLTVSLQDAIINLKGDVVESVHDLTSQNIADVARALVHLDLTYLSEGMPAVLEPMGADIWDVHGLYSLLSRPVGLTTPSGTAGATVVLVYDKGGYVHSRHPVTREMANQEALAATHRALKTFSQTAKILREHFPYLSLLRLDRMEERDYQQMDAMHLLGLEEVPAVVMFVEDSEYERVPFVFRSDLVTDASALAAAVQRALEKGFDSKYRGGSSRSFHARPPPQILNASDMAPEELNKYLKKTPRRSKKV